MNYLDLTNEAIRESGISLNALTSGNFTSSTLDPMYTKFKNFVIQAWEEIQTERRDWEYMQQSAVVRLEPSIEVYGGSSLNDLTSDFNAATFKLHNTANADIFTSRSSSAFTIESGALADDNAEGILKINSFAANTPFLLEPGDLLTTNSSSALCYFRRWGRYDLSQTGGLNRDDVSDIAEIKVDSVALTDYQYESGQSYTSVTWHRLQYIPYQNWQRYTFDRPTSVDEPKAFTISNDGRAEFWPPMDTFYHLSFEYTKTPQTFSTYSDTPTGLPARFHKAIAWRALMNYGEFEGIAQIYNRAKARYSKYNFEMCRDLLPAPEVGYDARKF